MAFIFRTTQKLLVFFSVFAPACKTPEQQSPVASIFAQMTLSKEDEQSIYLKMLGAELDAGIKIAKDQMHTAKGILTCRNSKGGRDCFLRTATRDGQFSADTAVGSDFTKKSWEWIETKRPDLAAAPLVNATVRCDYIGKKSPPYSIEDVSCIIERPLPPNETLIQSHPARAVFAALSVESETTQLRDHSLLAGSVRCRIIESSRRLWCVVGSFSEKSPNSWRELSHDVSRQIYKTLAQCQTPPDDQTELQASVHCSTEPHAVCQLKVE